MDLRSHAFLLLVVLLACASVAGAVLLWPRAAGHSVGAVLARLGLLLTCQLTAIIMIATSVNDQFDFYASWGELLGATQQQVLGVQSGIPDDQDGTSPAVPGDPPAGHRPHADEPPHPILDVNRQYAPPDPDPGEQETVQIAGGATGLHEQAYIYLPPQYRDPAQAHTRFPLVLVLAGYPGHIGTLIGSLGTIGTMNELVRTGHTRPFVLALMSPTLVPPRDTECTDVPGGPKVLSYFGEDVPRWLSAHYRLLPPGPSWGALGVSTGGYCAAKFAMTFPHVYSAAVDMSGDLHAARDATTGDLFHGDELLRQANDLVWRIAVLPPPPVRLLFTVGRTEHGVYPDIARFSHLARPPVQVDSIVLGDTGHNFGVFARLLPTCLQWLSASLGA